MNKAVIYARYSSHNQREESIEGQLRRCYEYAEKNGLVVIETYIDRAISGKTDDRAAFQRMIKDSEKGQFQSIIMYTLDRFARNRYDSAMYKAKLRRNGVKLHYTEQSISDEPEGIILESVLEGMAEYYSQNLSRGVRRGLKENALKCMVTGSVPLGYKKSSENKFEIDPVTAPVVEQIFDMYGNQGKSQRQIVSYLNANGYRTARGKPFRIGSLETILVNKKYIGIYEYEDVEIKDGVPAIVSEEVFMKVQKALKFNKRTSGRMKAPAAYLLTGKIFCGNCGEAMSGESGTSHTGTIYNYYKCFGRRKTKDCNKRNEKKDFIERLVVEETVRQVLQPDVIDAIAEKVAEIAERDFQDKSRIQALQDELSGVQTSIKNLLKLIERGIDSEDICERLLELKSQKADLSKQISKVENRKPSLSKDRIAFWLTRFINGGDIDDIEYQQRIIEALVNKVYVFDTEDGGRRLVITYNTSSNMKSTITLSDLKSSDITGLAAPKPSNPNLFFVKNCFGLIIEIPSRY